MRHSPGQAASAVPSDHQTRLFFFPFFFFAMHRKCGGDGLAWTVSSWRGLQRKRQSAREKIHIGSPVCGHGIHCTNLVSTPWVAATEFTELRREAQKGIAMQHQQKRGVDCTILMFSLCCVLFNQGDISIVSTLAHVWCNPEQPPEQEGSPSQVLRRTDAEVGIKGQ